MQMTRTKFARMRRYREKKWKREGYQRPICWREGAKTWRILRLPEVE
jgi:hypothetical protein